MRVRSPRSIVATVAVALVLGVALTLVVFRAVTAWEETRYLAEFARHAQSRAHALARTVETSLGVLTSLRGLYEASKSVERDEFRAFLQEPLAHHPQILALEWMPAVERGRQTEFEAVARSEGHPDFAVFDLGPNRDPIAAAERDWHFPVWFAEPGESREHSLGFDAAGEPDRWAAIVAARDTGTPVATERTQLLDDAGSAHTGLLVYLAIYSNDRPHETIEERRSGLVGVVSAVFHIPELAQVAFRDLPQDDVEVALVDATAEAEELLCPGEGCGAGKASAAAGDAREEPLRYELAVAHRRWVLVCRPAAAFRAAHARWQPWLALFTGLLFTALLGGFLASTLRHTALVETEVAQRTADLTREVAERQQEQSRLALQFAVTRACVETHGLGETADAVLRTVGTALGWDTGALWLFDEHQGQLRCLRAWNGAGAPMEAFLAATASRTFGRGEGMPGRVWQSGEPEWDVDLTSEGDFLRAEAAARAGLRTGFGVPVVVGGRFLGVLEFFRRDRYSPEPTLRDLIRSLGGQLGQAIDRRRAEDALKESEERYRDLFENASDLIQTVDPGGNVLYANGAWYRTLGYGEMEAAGLSLSRVVHPDSLSGFLSALQKVCAGEPVDKVEAEFVARDGRRIAVEGTLDCKFVAGRPAFVRSILRDCTEQRRMERLKGEFLSTVSHELRTPLTSIRGALGLLAGGVAGELPGSAHSMVAIALRNSERLVRLINDLLDVERIESGRLQIRARPVELLPLVEQAIEANRPFAEQFDVRLRLTRSLPQGRIHADADRVVQVLTNLLANAAKFSPAGSTVEVEVARRDGSVRVAVHDRGPGIPEPFRQRVFEKFAQADSSDRRHRGGTGLGLSIAKALVEQMGGRIGYESHGEQGTTFAFEFPEWTGADAPRVEEARR